MSDKDRQPLNAHGGMVSKKVTGTKTNMESWQETPYTEAFENLKTRYTTAKTWMMDLSTCREAWIMLPYIHLVLLWFRIGFFCFFLQQVVDSNNKLGGKISRLSR